MSASQVAAFQAWNLTGTHDTPFPDDQTGDDLEAGRSSPKFSEAMKIIGTPRQYQIDLFERAKEKNTIVVLDTGMGKTLIAALLLRHILGEEMEARSMGRQPRTAFFVVDKVVLCLQQYHVLCANLEYPVTVFHGDTVASDLRSREDWDIQAQKQMVVVCTAQILLDLLGNGILTMSQISLLVFDEAHHTKKKHPYAKIVKDHYLCANGDRPRILGMTASPVDTRTGDLRLATLELENMLCSKIATVSDEILIKEKERKQQMDIVVQYDVVQTPESARTQLWRDLKPIFELRTEFSSHFAAAEDVASVLGAWCADEYWRTLFMPTAVSKLHPIMRRFAALRFQEPENLDSADGSAADHFLEDEETDPVAAAILKAQTMLEALPPSVGRVTGLHNHFSTKFICLHNILSDEFAKDQTRRCIVFVGKRYLSVLLAHAFSQPEIRIPNLAAGYVVGSSNVASGIANMSVKDQFRALYQFRRGEINCLFATQIAEEGLDIPDCDLIVRFDLYQSAIQYIQSRGRARSGRSTFITMIESQNLEHHRRRLEATRATNAMRQFIAALSADRKVTDVDQTEMATNLTAEVETQRVHRIAGTGAQLTYESSQQVLSKFVSSLSGSLNAASLYAQYVVTRASSGNNFVATVILPDSSPIKAFRGTPQRSKILARGSAAFAACLKLLRGAYINDHLQSNFVKQLPAMRNARLAISLSKRSEYSMLIRPKIWSKLGIANEFFLAILHVDSSVLPGQRGRPLGLLTRSRLPRIPTTKLYFPMGGTSKVITRSCRHPIPVDHSQLKLLTQFTLVIFRDVFSKEFDATEEQLPYFFAPCMPDLEPVTISSSEAASTAIDWTTLSDTKTNDVERKPIPGRSDEYCGRLITDPWNGGRKFIARGTEPSLRAFDPVPADVPHHKSSAYARVDPNIAEYSNSLSIKSRNRMKWDPDQPVFRADLLPLHRDFLCPFQDDVNRSCTRCFIILEPLTISPLTVDTVLTALILPVMMYRINSVAIVMDACMLLGLQDIDPSLALEAFTKGGVNSDQDDGQQANLENENLQQGMGNNYERLEFLGDSFLKMATTISLFTREPHGNEFEYHVQRMTMVCNRNLFNHAVDKRLQQYVRSHGFDRRTWYPDLKLSKGKALKTSAVQSLADKSIADVCEAIIGAAYMTGPEGQMDLAVKAVTTMVNSEQHSMTKFSDYIEAYVVPKWHLQPSSAMQRHAVQKLQKTLGYTFQSPRLLRSAFKHPSYPYEVEIPDYQRLEFLGDALLDFAISDYLFRNFPSADPQWLTEHKMSMVSNHFFACLCIELGLHQHLLAATSSMTSRIPAFVAELKQAKTASAQSSDNGDADPDYWLHVSDPPKALGDVLEAVVGAMFVDSKYDYGLVVEFFTKFVVPYFRDMSLYDSFAAGHPVTVLTKRMQDVFCCRQWRLCLANVPCSSEEGAAAMTESNVVCALMIHGQAIAHATRATGRQAKVDVATKSMRRFRDMSKDAFCAEMKCDCKALGSNE